MENISSDEPQNLQSKIQHASKLLAADGTEYTSVALPDQNLLVENVQSFYESIGKMTRMVHSATTSLDELHSTDGNGSTQELGKQPQVNFLNYVKDLTADAASKVLDNLEAATPLINATEQQNKQFSEEILAFRDQSNSKETQTLENAEALLDRVQSQLEQNTNAMTTLSESQNEILMLQSYQDLTSQAITKAETLLKNVESTLADLLKSFSTIEGVSSTMDDASLAADSDSKEPAESDQLQQDDVDSLLSSLGF